MDNLDTKLSASPDSALQEQVDSLRHLLTSALILLIIVSATFNLYLWRVVKNSRNDTAAFRIQTTQMLAEYERVQQPAMQDFVRRLVEFGRSPNSDETFAALLKKYGLSNLVAGTNAPAVAPVTAPTTGAPAPVAK
jgi:hypothetical protein